jgi:type IX secretion system PorP/SprF family membrane protein
MYLKNMIKNLFLTAIAILILESNSSAQINPMAAQYFQNTYMANPAMAGVNKGIRLNLGYRNQWSNIQGSPKNLSLTADYGSEKVGVGLNFYKDEAGLLNRSKLQATYAYHLPLNNEGRKLHFGISLGLQTNSLNTQNIVGSSNDFSAMRYNDLENIIDGDFGMAYSDKMFRIEGSISNLKNQLEIEDNEISDYATFMTAFTYMAQVSDWKVHPKLVYRGVKNFNDILDMGLELRTPDDQLGFMSMYHTNKSMSFGLTYQKLKQWQLLVLYNTPVQALKSYATGTFEIGLQVRIVTAPKEKKKKEAFE